MFRIYKIDDSRNMQCRYPAGIHKNAHQPHWTVHNPRGNKTYYVCSQHLVTLLRDDW